MLLSTIAFQAESNVPQRIASRHTGRGRRVLDQSQPAAHARPAPATNHARPRSLLTDHVVPSVGRPDSLLDDDMSAANRVSGIHREIRSCLFTKFLVNGKTFRNESLQFVSLSYFILM